MNAHHEKQRTQDRHHAGEQLGKAHEQAISKGVHIRNDPADNIPLGMGIQIAQGQLLDMHKGLVADVPGDAEGHPVIQLTHEPLRRPGYNGTDQNVAKVHAHLGKIHMTGIHDAVDGGSHQNGNVQGHDHIDRRQHQRGDQAHPIPADPVKDFLQNQGLVIHALPPPWGTGNNRFPDRWGNRQEACHGCPSLPGIRHPAPEFHRRSGRRPPAGRR